MSRCIYTGAIVSLVDYGCTVVADVFELPGGAILIQWMQGSEAYEGENGEPTHTAIVCDGYHHEKRGVTVVRPCNFQGERR